MLNRNTGKIKATGDIDTTQMYKINDKQVLMVYGTDNLFIDSSGNKTLTGVENIGIGDGVLISLTTGKRNVAIGKSSLKDNTTGDSNFGLGTDTLIKNTTGSYNVAVGVQTLISNEDGDANTALGNTALGLIKNGNNNVAIGAVAGVLCTGSGNVFLGYGAGFFETGSNKLYIANNYDSDPLIYGDFSIDFLKINGDLMVANRLIRSKSIYTDTDTTDNVYLHICDKADGFTLTIPDGADDGEEIKIINKGVGTITLSGKINLTTATNSLLTGEKIILNWDTIDDEWQ